MAAVRHLRRGASTRISCLKKNTNNAVYVLFYSVWLTVRPYRNLWLCLYLCLCLYPNVFDFVYIYIFVYVYCLYILMSMTISMTMCRCIVIIFYSLSSLSYFTSETRFFYWFIVSSAVVAPLLDCFCEKIEYIMS